jgi:mono/diheme cytochrome c family protein
MSKSITHAAIATVIALIGLIIFYAPARGDEATVKLYQSKCATCHAADGSGNTPAGKVLKLKDIRSPEVQAMTDAELATIIAKGKDKMPPYEKTMKADQIQSMVAYMRDLAKK